MPKSYKINKGFIIQKMDNEITIFDGEKSLLFSFNASASFIFSKIKLGWDKEKIINAVLNKYDTTIEKAQGDLNAIINDLLIHKVITQKAE